MLIAMLLMAVNCAAPGRCPTEDQLRAAVSRRDVHEARQLADEMREGNPDVPVSVEAERIIALTDIRCAEEWSDEPGWINCSFRVRYPTRTILEIAQLSREDGGWELKDWMRSTVRQR